MYSNIVGSTRRRLALKAGDIEIRLYRLDGDESAILGQRTVLIHDAESTLSAELRQPPPALPRTRFGLERLFGPSSAICDFLDHSLSFSFLAVIDRCNITYPLLFHVFDKRGEAVHRLYRILTEDGPRADLVPYTTLRANGLLELEHREFLVGFWRCVDASADQAGPSDEDLPVYIDSERLVYGCRQGQFFMERFDSADEYMRRRETLRARHAEAQRQRATALVHRIERERLE
jgi:hypothetical protein